MPLPPPATANHDSVSLAANAIAPLPALVMANVAVPAAEPTVRTRGVTTNSIPPPYAPGGPAWTRLDPARSTGPELLKLPAGSAGVSGASSGNGGMA